MDSFTITVPDFDTIWNAFRWYHVFFITGVYGLITHWKTLPAIKRWNAKVKREDLDDKWFLGSLDLISVMLCRMSFTLPLRILAGSLGIAEFVLSIISSCSFQSNGLLKFGWRWHMTAEELGKLGCSE